MRMHSVILVATVAIGLSSMTARAEDPPGAPDDPFLFYKAKVTKNTTAFTSLTATLVNAFDNATYTLKKAVNLCTPASVDGETVSDANTHQVSYTVKLASGPAHVPQTNIKVVDAFALDHPLVPALLIDTVKPDVLLVPSSKTLMPPPLPPPDLGSIDVDHYLCYKIKIHKGTPKFVAQTNVPIADQFTGMLTPKNFDIKKPKHLCVPTNVNGGGIKNAGGYLMCYTAKPSKGAAKAAVHSGVNVNNEFAPNPLQLDTAKETELCTPAIINPICGDNVVNDPAEQCDGTDDSACPGNCNAQCKCPTPHPFVIDPMHSLIKVRGVLGPDSDFQFTGLSGTVMIETGAEISPGVVELFVPVTTLPPINISGVATACVFLVEDPSMPGSGLAGTGVLNCAGTAIASPSSPDFVVNKDHCTNGILCDSHPVSSNCSTALGPGKLHVKSGESSICVPEGPEDLLCTATDAFTGTSASLESASDPHTGVCTSPMYGSVGSSPWTAGQASITLNVALDVRGPSDPCNGPPVNTPLKGPLTTGTATSTIMDAFPSTAPAAGKVQALAVTGAPFSCSGGTLGSTTGAVLVTGVPILDANLPSPFSLGDLNAALILQGQ